MKSMAMAELARLIKPDHEVVSVSTPEPALRRLNVVGSFHSAEVARNAVLALESMSLSDEAVGLTVLRSPDQAQPVPHTEPGLDPEGIGGDIGPRAAKGAVIGALVGAVLVGAIAAVMGGASSALAGVLGGILFGAAIGATWGAFSRMGGSDAYRDSFVKPELGQLVLVSLHTDSDTEAEEATNRIGLASDGPPVTVAMDDTGLSVLAP